MCDLFFTLTLVIEYLYKYFQELFYQPNRAWLAQASGKLVSKHDCILLT